MNYASLRHTLRAALFTGTALSGVAVVASANAQDQTAATRPQVEEIVVTGTRITDPSLTSASPIAVVSFEQIQAVGTTNLEEFVRSIPQAVAAEGSNTNNGNQGAATIDLRNLGRERTLVLVDGKRFVPFDTQGWVDVSMIPVSMIERVEVVTGGASAVYGSDAIAGVVNFIMKKNFQGVEGTVQYGVSGKGDANKLDLSATAGGKLAEGKGNFTINATYTDQKAVYQGARDFSNFALAAADFSPGGSSTAPEGILLLSNGFRQFDANGNLVPRFQKFNFNPYNLLQVPQKKWTATAMGHYDISDSIEYYARLSVANNRVETIIAPTGTFGFPFDINYATNPFLTAQAKGVLAAEDTAANGDPRPGDGTVTVAVLRRMSELGTRNSFYENTAFQFVNGLKGDIGNTGLKFDTFVQAGRVTRAINYENDIDAKKVQQALLAVRDASGNIVCQDPSNGCAPANIFGLGKLSAAAANFIRFNLSENDSTNQIVAGGQVTGDLPFTIPAAGKAGGFAVGVEWRREAGTARPDNNLINGNAPGFGSSQPIDARFHTTEVFGETIVPLVRDAAFAKSINFDGGIRYSWYGSTVLGAPNNKSENVTYKAGGDWSPVQEFRLRGSYQRAVRAPNLNELGLPKQFGTGDLTNDYCAGTNPVGNAALTALCVATGVPANRIGNVAGPISGQINNFLGGNPALQPEKSNTFTIGGSFRPESFAKGLVLSLDYYSIKVNNAIVTPTEQSIVDACYLIEKSAAGPNCKRIQRNALNGSLNGDSSTGVVATKVNAAAYRAEGLDFGVNYGFEMGSAGNLNLDWVGTHVFKTIQQDAASLPANNCAGLVGKTCLRPDPKWRFTQTTTWNWRDLTVQVRWQYLSKLTNSEVGLGKNKPSDFVVPVIPSYHYFDLTASYALTSYLTVRGGVRNLFDKQPPVVGNDYGGTTQTSGNTYPATYDPIGRSFFFGATAKF
jgi:outer membrane receptor protein involved in Fe transport